MKTFPKKLVFVIIFLFAFAYFYNFTRFTKNGTTIINGIMVPVEASFYYLALISFITIIIKTIEKKKFIDFGLDFSNIIKKIIFGIILGITIVILKLLIFGINDKNIIIIQLLIYIPFNLFLLAFAEEIIFRGYIFDKIKNLLNSNICAIIFSSIIFGFWHYPLTNSLVTVIITSIIGLFLSTAKVLSKEKIIISLIICHTFYNLSANIIG